MWAAEFFWWLDQDEGDQVLGKSLLWPGFKRFSFLVQKDKDMSRSLIPVYVDPSRSAAILLPLQVWDHFLLRELSLADDKTRASVIISDGAVFTTRKRTSAFPTVVNAEELSLQIRKKLTRAWISLLFFLRVKRRGSLYLSCSSGDTKSANYCNNMKV